MSLRQTGYFFQAGFGLLGTGILALAAVLGGQAPTKTAAVAIAMAFTMFAAAAAFFGIAMVRRDVQAFEERYGPDA